MKPSLLSAVRSLASIGLSSVVLALGACSGSIEGDTTGESGDMSASGAAGPGSTAGPGKQNGTPAGTPSGTPSGNTGAPGGPTSTPGTGGPATNPGDATAAGPMPLRRLTRREYNNTVNDLLGDTSNQADPFPVETGAGFVFQRAGSVASQDALLIRSAAETIAAKARAGLPTLVACDVATGNDACARKFIESFGLRAYRRPLATTDADALMAHYTLARKTLKLSFADSMVFLIETMLQTPEFLYHWEMGPGPAVREGAVVRLGPYEVASRLSAVTLRQGSPQDAGQQNVRVRAFRQLRLAGPPGFPGPAGFSMEHFDVAGAWRTIDAQRTAVDSTGVLKAEDGTSAGSFDGARSLGRLLKKDRRMVGCLTRAVFSLVAHPLRQRHAVGAGHTLVSLQLSLAHDDLQSLTHMVSMI